MVNDSSATDPVPSSAARLSIHATDGRVQGAVDRITVALIPKAGEDLQRLQERTQLSKTDIVNRAVTLYEFIDGQLRAGRDILIRNPDTGETQTVLIL